jgi:hypothetical protein
LKVLAGFMIRSPPLLSGSALRTGLLLLSLLPLP